MNSAAQHLIPFSHFERLRAGREILRQESDALLNLSKQLDTSFCNAVETLLNCTGSVIVCGMGKAGLIGKKIAATLSSTGTRAHFLHPAEAVHGDLGALHSSDVFLALSNSGETEELLQILPAIKEFHIPIISITATRQNSLASHSNVVIEIGRLKEACPWGLAPSTSTTAMLAVGDALALVAAEARGFSPREFARFHPGGSLGLKLKPVVDLMRQREEIRIASCHTTVREVMTTTARPGRRTGAVLLINDDETLAGIFTDSDLARLLESRRDSRLDEKISEVMTVNPMTIRADAVLGDVIDLFAQRRISEVPVIDSEHKPIGLIDITDVIGWLPKESGE
ncbi:KpsF/GutQ family sugar-phosphate isomerase [Planctomicrobium sp. SH527]|uniref:KpsF/GutQ family sugar-phosphate isomerase n=1 Tax=Planctomicrobium sp. SH527 TaxID=3448123 RepID=UPI003F5B8BFE